MHVSHLQPKGFDKQTSKNSIEGKSSFNLFDVSLDFGTPGYHLKNSTTLRLS
jgi:hypothetical protein